MLLDNQLIGGANVVVILLHIFQGLFALMAMLALFGFVGSKTLGLLLASVAYGAGAYASFSMDIWWPLGAAFACAWILRLLGMDPSADSVN